MPGAFSNAFSAAFDIGDDNGTGNGNGNGEVDIIAEGYITTDQIIAAVPLVFPSEALDDNRAVMQQWITRADGLVDARVGNAYPTLESMAKFLYHPDTPAIIQECSLNYSLSFAYEYLQILSGVGVDFETIESYRKRATDLLDSIRAGELDPVENSGDFSVEASFGDW